ncbi:MAG: benzoate-CoA ligase family protein, partial [Pseudomonadota bacterium]
MHDTAGNAASYFVDRHCSGDRAGQPAFIEIDGDKRQLSYAELAEQSDRVPALLKQHGSRREERAIMLVLDQIEFPIVFWGCLKAGVVPVPLSTLLATPVYEWIFADSRARTAFVSAALLPLITPFLKDHPTLETVFVIGEAGDLPDKAVAFAPALASAPIAKACAASADDTAFWLYSSGSTGQPKGVRHVHGSLQATADTYGKQVLGIAPDDRVYSAAKLFFAYGLGNAMTFPMSVGATSYLLAGRPTPEVVIDALRSYEPTVFCGVPTLYAGLLSTLAQRNESLPGIRCCISAGEALPAEIGHRWRDLVGTDILDGVGSTEMLHIFLSNRADAVDYGASGQAVPGYALRLINEDGSDVEEGGIGELLVDGPSASEGYWNLREKNRATFEGRWTRTGDKYQRDGDRLIYCGRADDLFKVGGIWVSPFEVEQSLIGHAAVLECAVVAALDDDRLEKPKAFVARFQDHKSFGLFKTVVV